MQHLEMNDMGTKHYPLTEQIKDTIQVHGLDWAEWHYVFNEKGPKLSPWEWSMLSPRG